MRILLAPQDEIGSSTPHTVLMKSVRTVRALDRYSRLNYIFFTNGENLKAIEKFCKMEFKWKLVMKKEMDPLIQWRIQDPNLRRVALLIKF